MSESQVVTEPKGVLPSFDQVLGLVTFIIVALIIYAFGAGIITRFYTSFVFLFYSLLKSMWISVVCLGVFQTLLLIPFRLVNLKNNAHINEFREQMEGVEKGRQKTLFKQTFKTGNKALLFYIINFFVQIFSYVAIGKLFLTDFYTKPLDHRLLYNFVPYPQYPIKDTWFKIPYPVVVKTIDLGVHIMIVALVVVCGVKIFTSLFKGYVRKNKISFFPPGQQDMFSTTIRSLFKVVDSSFFLLCFLAWWLTRHFPVGWQIRIFSGDVSKPFPTFNLITAILATLVIIWLEMPKIILKVRLAIEKGIPTAQIRKTEGKLFKQTIMSAILIGLGAFFITNQIPCAFELSVFTFEVISWISPFTLDKLVYRR